MVRAMFGGDLSSLREGFGLRQCVCQQSDEKPPVGVCTFWSCAFLLATIIGKLTVTRKH